MALPATIPDRMAVLAPEALLLNVTVDTYVSIAEERTSLDIFTTKSYDQAVALRALHMIQKKADAKKGLAGGVITAKKEKNLSVSFSAGSNNTDNADLMTTAWGQQLLQLVSETVVGPLTCDI